MGTIFSVILAILFIPPKNINEDIIPTNNPTKIFFQPKAFTKDTAIEFDCTILPIKPKASIIVIEKQLDKIFANLPLKI